MAAEHGPTAGEYIVHHLTHLQNHKPASVVDFTVFNFDSLFWSIALGVLGCWLLWLAARKATSGVPGRFQAAVEILVEMVDYAGQGHRAQRQEPQVRRAAGADRVRLDLPDERDGPAAGRPAAR